MSAQEAAFWAIVDAFNRQDFDALLAVTAPEFEMDLADNRGDWAGVYSGTDQVRQLFATLVEPWEALRIEVRDLSRAGDGLLAQVTLHFRGRDGIAVTARVNWVCTFRDGMPLRMVAFNDLADALEAAGLRGVEAERVLQGNDASRSIGDSRTEPD